MRKWLSGLAAGLVLGAAVGAIAHEAASGLPDRPPGSNEVLKAGLESAPDLEVILSDVVIPAKSAVPRHFHPGEEFVYVLEGSAIHVEEGAADRVYGAGEAFVIRRGKVHAPRAGETPVRAVVFRVHVKGEPERTLVE